MFINMTNHPVSKWNKDQVDVASLGMEVGYQVIYDFSQVMPQVDPEANTCEVEDVGDELIQKLISQVGKLKGTNILVQGEYTLTFYLVLKLTELGAKCFTATTKREVVENKMPDGSVKKESIFKFVQFRQYPL